MVQSVLYWSLEFVCIKGYVNIGAVTSYSTRAILTCMVCDQYSDDDDTT